MDVNLEVIVIPVSDVDKAKAFYVGMGWRLDLDLAPNDRFRVVQLTPPGSGCSVTFGTGLTSSEPGSYQKMHLVTADIMATRAELVDRGVAVSEVFHGAGSAFHPQAGIPGPDPDRTSYASYATFEDPDGNGWVLQEVTTRLPGR
jgi:catechol 2,3-dioxygenase-like lactoylglutathione lyase family enzyme